MLSKEEQIKRLAGIQSDIASQRMEGLAPGVKKRDLSKFIAEAVKWRVFDQTLAETREKFADLGMEDLQAMIDEATTSVRAEMSHRGSKTDS